MTQFNQSLWQSNKGSLQPNDDIKAMVARRTLQVMAQVTEDPNRNAANGRAIREMIEHGYDPEHRFTASSRKLLFEKGLVTPQGEMEAVVTKTLNDMLAPKEATPFAKRFSPCP